MGEKRILNYYTNAIWKKKNLFKTKILESFIDVKGSQLDKKTGDLFLIALGDVRLDVMDSIEMELIYLSTIELILLTDNPTKKNRNWKNNRMIKKDSNLKYLKKEYDRFKFKKGIVGLKIKERMWEIFEKVNKIIWWKNYYNNFLLKMYKKTKKYTKKYILTPKKNIKKLVRFFVAQMLRSRKRITKKREIERKIVKMKFKEYVKKKKLTRKKQRKKIMKEKKKLVKNKKK